MNEQTMNLIKEINTIRNIKELCELNTAMINRMKRINATALNCFNVGALVEVSFKTGWELGTIISINRKTATIKMMDGGSYRVHPSFFRVAEKKEEV